MLNKYIAIYMALFFWRKI